ncbi:O-antigen ligase family protein [Pontibacterium sp. N1Y112]|uniref:O-antigen ligase family protein n=1 Tax=Pontibacterium sinense TaxID=2781979 RepID=A0A8J7FDN2_9GAMM|nr:O-antigen ligase family protein [Pontibacterium sinense]MBE9399152.1 O-antigen ligase family protein [Pontibacterium sinense]
MADSANKSLSSILMPLGFGLLSGVLFVFLLGNLPLKWTFFILLAVTGVGGLLFLNILQVRTKQLMLMLAAFLMPILYDINFYYQEDPPFYVHANGFGVAITDVLFAMLIIAWAAETVVGKRSHHPPAPVPTNWKFAMIGLFLINFLSAVTTPEPFFAFSMLWQQVKVYFIFVYLIKNVNSFDTVKRLGYVFVAVLATQAVIVFEQKLVGAIFTDSLLGQRTTWQNTGGPLRVSGTLGQPNALAMFMNQLMLIGIFLGLSEKNTLRKLAILGFVAFAAMAEIFTASRGGWAGLAIAFVVCMVLWRMRRGNGLIASISLVALVGSVLFSALFLGSGDFRARLTQDDKGTAEVRIPLMEVAENLVAANPLTGVGLNHYTYYMAQYDRTFDAITANFDAPVHNTFMLIAGEIGIPGAMFAIAMILFTLYRSFMLFFRSDGTISAIALGIFGGVLSWVIHNTVDPTSIYSEYPFWILSGLCIAMDRIHAKQQAKLDHRSASGPDPDVKTA